MSDPSRQFGTIQVNKKLKKYKTEDGIVRGVVNSSLDQAALSLRGMYLKQANEEAVQDCVGQGTMDMYQFGQNHNAYALQTVASNTAGPSSSVSYTASSFR